MSPRRASLSVLILFHVIALAVNTIPPPSSFEAAGAAPSAIDASSPPVPMLGRAASALAAFDRRLFAVSTPLRSLTWIYGGAFLRQAWDMFSRPQPYDHYVRLGYHVTSRGASTPHVVLDLVYPADRDDRVRVTHAYRDKAVATSFETFFAGRARGADAAAAFEPLRPMVVYFTREYARQYLSPGDEIVGTDVWYGSAEIPPPGQRPRADDLAARQAVLARYYEGPVPVISSRLKPRDVSAQEGEAGIQWMLLAADR